MKGISRRLRKLEDRFLPRRKRSSDRRLRQRMEAGLRRLGEAPGETPHVAVRPRDRLDAGTIAEILDARPQRARLDALREAGIATDMGPQRRRPPA